MFLFGFFASPLPYILLMLFSMSGYAMVCLQGKSAADAANGEQQENQQEHVHCQKPQREASNTFEYLAQIAEVTDKPKIIPINPGIPPLIDPPPVFCTRISDLLFFSRPPPAVSFL